MSDKLRIGVLGLTHDHVWSESDAIVACEETELVAAADPNGPLTARFAEQYACPVYSTSDELLESETLDAVYVYGNNFEGAALSIQAMNRGLHALIEKPLAANLEDANRMVAAARENGVRLLVNWPFTWWPQLQKALEMAKAGELGEIIGVNYRAAHCGPEELGCSKYFCDWLFDEKLNGAGAMMDYCCYGSVLAALLMGMPESVTGIEGGQVKDFLSVEDSGVIAMKYPRGISVASASWTQVGNLTSYATVIYGEKGTLVVDPKGDGKLYLATKDNPNGVEVSVPASDISLKDSAHHLAAVVKNGQEPWLLCRDEFSRDAQEILEAGIRSAKTGQQVVLPLG
jgi:predicted dehydrogenase